MNEQDVVSKGKKRRHASMLSELRAESKADKRLCQQLMSQRRSSHTVLPVTPRCSLKRDIDKHGMMASLNGIATHAPRR